MLFTFAGAFSQLLLLAAAIPQVYRAFPGATTEPPHPWRVTQKTVDRNEILQLLVAIRPPRKSSFEKALLELSDPRNPNYGKHLSKETVADYFRPTESGAETVQKWLHDAGVAVTRISSSGGMIDVSAPAHVVERLLQTKLAWYTDGEETLLRTIRYSIPENIAPLVLTVNPLTHFPSIDAGEERKNDRHKRSIQARAIFKRTNDGGPVEGSLDKVLLPHCNMTVGMTPACLKQLYNFNDKPDPRSKSKLGIAGYARQYAKRAYLRDFLKVYAPDAYAANATFDFEGINGGINNETDLTVRDHEGNMDTQYGVALTFPLRRVTYYMTAGSGPLIPDLDNKPGTNKNAPFLETIRHILRLPNKDLPHVLTVSYGADEQTSPVGYMELVCSLFAQLGARGVSVLFASGDTGPGSSCLSNDGRNRTTFNPIFPATCPWVTSVGSVYSFQPEIATPISTGGFSDVFPRPAYQNADARKYLDYLASNWTGLFNPLGRAFPDVAAQGYDFKWNQNGRIGGFSGTSAAAPTFAAVIARINAARMARGRPTMGFLNPWLYSVGRKGLNDVTVGQSFGCYGETKFTKVPAALVPEAGFNATEGWDAVTGLGTPDLGKMMKIAMNSYY